MGGGGKGMGNLLGQTGVPDPTPWFTQASNQGAQSIINADKDLGVSAGLSRDLANNALRNRVALSQASLAGAGAQASELPGLINLINQQQTAAGQAAGFGDAAAGGIGGLTGAG